MTQGELGDRVGVTRQTIAAIEQGKYSPSLEVAFRIARTFGKPLETVFRWDTDQDSPHAAAKRRPRWLRLFSFRRYDESQPRDRKRGGTATSVSVRVDLGGRRIIKQKKPKT